MVLVSLDRLLRTGRLAVTSGYSMVAEPNYYRVTDIKTTLTTYIKTAFARKHYHA